MSPWQQVEFGSLVPDGLSNGLSPSRRGKVPGEVLTISAITRGGYDRAASKEALFDKAPKDTQLATPGTFLICRGNGNISLVGRGHVATAVGHVPIFPDTIIGGKLNESRVDARFLEFAWATPAVRSQIVAGANTKNGTHKVNQKTLSAIKIPLPPLPEQRHIAAILDQADAVRRARREAIGLTEELLRSVFLEMFGDPVVNPRGWQTRPLGEVAMFIGGGTPSRKTPEFFTGDICWATCKDMGSDNLLGTQEQVTEEAIAKSATKLVPTGTLLVVVKSKVLLRRLLVAMTTRPTCFDHDLKGLILPADWPSLYVARHLRVGQRILLEQARGAKTEGLTLDHLRRYPLMVPPLDLRQRFAEIEQDTVSSIHTQNTAAATADTLFSSLLQRAFRGEL